MRGLAAAIATAAATLLLSAGSSAQQTPAGAALTPPAGASPTVPAAPAKGSAATLGWLTGCWRANVMRDGSTINEVWLAPQAGTLMGIGQTFVGTRTLGWEAMRIYDAGESMKLWLRPGARPELTLDLVESTATVAGFSLTEAGSTTQLRYERTGDTTLMATFRLIKGEDRRGADFSFNRVECAEMFAAAADKSKVPPAEAPKTQ
jgi:hypothetical protein